MTNNAPEGYTIITGFAQGAGDIRLEKQTSGARSIRTARAVGANVRGDDGTLELASSSQVSLGRFGLPRQTNLSSHGVDGHDGRGEARCRADAE